MSVSFSEFGEIIESNPFLSQATLRELRQSLAEGQTFYMVPASISPRYLAGYREYMGKVVVIPPDDFELLTFRSHKLEISDEAYKMGLRIEYGVIVYNDEDREPR